VGEKGRELARSRVRAMTVTHMHQVQVGDHLISVDDTPIGLSHGAPSNAPIALHNLHPSLRDELALFMYIFVYEKHGLLSLESFSMTPLSPSVLLQGRVRGRAFTWLTLHLRGLHTHTHAHTHTQSQSPTHINTHINRVYSFGLIFCFCKNK